MESLLYAFFISESEAPGSNPRILNGSNTWIWVETEKSYASQMELLRYMHMLSRPKTVLINYFGIKIKYNWNKQELTKCLYYYLHLYWEYLPHDLYV